MRVTDAVTVLTDPAWSCDQMSTVLTVVQVTVLQVFEKFATSEWDLRILSGFLAADQVLGEPTRVPCCDYPPTHAPV